ncbi:hypothetical protein T8K17_11465 [Thalassobaculum sp. OXR-137]|uniref:hypothetical protein n=1 Tax=Thalassobaculum sp. OXR-137 TaxID=3100173 RepID=UPI002AC9ACB1|nr:hypothetical protein [Thalassobaculum sp. OXR-137]WPZ36753.1 hypothetical protein T8K17_11465 [Thalassobaculum sp. OXR-137]
MIGQERQCKECDGPFVAQRVQHRFCSGGCRKSFHNRRQARGQKIYDLLMLWRYDRPGDGREAHKLICRYASDFKEQDRLDDRGPSWLTLAEMREDGLLGMVSATVGRT